MQDLASVVIVVSLVGFVVGVGVVGTAIARARARGRAARGVAPSWRIAQLPEDATGRVTGEVAPAARTVIAPLSGRSCVYYRVRVSELRARSGLAARHHLEWTPIIDEHHGVEFMLDDGSGRILIDPNSAAIELRAVRVRVTGNATALNRHEAALLRRHGITALDGLGQPRRLRFEEVAIEVGQSVIAIGSGERDPATSTTDLWGLRPPSTPLRMAGSRISDAVPAQLATA